ncbi:MAG: dTDP-4-dehydrorhamnose reductase [Flavobacteriales bacterium]
MSKRLLITGANGLLGQSLVDFLMNKNQWEACFTGRGTSRLNPKHTVNYKTLDITDYQSIESIISNYKPTAIIHCAAMTNVDGCEQHPETCYENNTKSVEHFIRAIGKKNIQFVFISTDFVFDGKAQTPYLESDPINPLSVYAKSKAKAEQLLLESDLHYTILRTSFVYGQVFDGSSKNFYTWAKNSLKNEEHIKVFSDQIKAPTFADDLAMACLLAVDNQSDGIFNITGPESKSLFDFVMQLAEYYNFDQSLVQAIETKTLNLKAPRPLYTALEGTKAKQKFKYNPLSFKESLKQMDLKSFD